MPSASDRLPPVSTWIAIEIARKSISGLSMIRATRQSAASSVSPSITRSLIARKWPPTGSGYSWPTPPMHSITGRPERMPRMMVSMRVGQLLHEAVGLPVAAELHEAVGGEHAEEEPRDQDQHQRLAESERAGEHRRERRATSEIDTKVATDQSSSARRKLARSRAVSSSGMKRASASVSVTMAFFSCFCLRSVSRASSRSIRPDMPPAADPGQPLAVLVLQPQHHGDHEEAQPDRDRDRDEEEREGDDQVARHPIASRSRVPRPKYSARGMKCGRRWLHSKRPEMLPSAFSPS